MIAAIDTQWLAVGVVALVVAAALIVVLVRRRARDERSRAPGPRLYDQNAPAVALAGGGSFLDEPLARGFEGLGRPIAATAAAAGPAAVADPEPVDPFSPRDELFRESCVRGVIAPEPEPAVAAQLSDVIVTSEHERVDLGDPEVRDMLTELMQDEIDLARVQRDQGDTLDAILQLTEAEKIAAALHLDDKGAEIRGLLARLER